MILSSSIYLHPAHNKTSDSDAKPKRTKKVPLVLDLNKKLEDLEKCLKLSKATSVTQATWAKYTKKKTTLPDDHMMDSKEGLFRLFHRPNLMVILTFVIPHGNTYLCDTLITD